MNDFTKEDLYMLRRAVINLHKIDDKDSIESPLYKKIQSMINNYCEHDGYAKCRFCGEDFRGINT